MKHSESMAPAALFDYIFINYNMGSVEDFNPQMHKQTQNAASMIGSMEYLGKGKAELEKNIISQ